MCTVLLPPGDNPIRVNKYIISQCNDVYIASPSTEPTEVILVLAPRGEKNDFNNGFPSENEQGR
jgi:hypothetical protein